MLLVGHWGLFVARRAGVVVPLLLDKEARSDSQWETKATASMSYLGRVVLRALHCTEITGLLAI